MMKSTAMCLTWRGMGSIRLYFVRDSPCDENKQPYHTGSVTGKNGGNWLQNYLWCPNDPRGEGIDDDDDEQFFVGAHVAVLSL